ncbi:MAG: DUF11 domain-containing protein [bacterium]|nr:DUF11 domain-containing protein [bacterium]
MLKFIRNTLYLIMTACILLAVVSSMQAADVPSGPVAVFPDKEPSEDDDLGTDGSGSVDDDNSNLTIDFGFYVPTPTPTSTPTSTPASTSTSTSTSTSASTSSPALTSDGEAIPSPVPGTTDVSGLSLSKSVSNSSVDAGQSVVYTIVIRNAGDLPVYNVTLQDDLPEGFSYVSGSAYIDGGAVELNVNGDSFQIVIAEIPARGSVSVSYTVNVSLNVPTGQHENVVSIPGGQQDSALVTVGGNRREGLQFGKRRETVDIWEPCVVVPAEIEKPWFITDIAMYAASELYTSSHPFIRWSVENGLTLDQHVFSPTGVREFGAEIFQYSVENISTLMSNSGLGLHLKYAPFIVAGAKAQGFSPEAYLEQRLQAYAQRSNLKVVPQQIYPLFIEYAEGDPRYTQVTDVNNWNTLLWERRSFNRHLIPSAYGQSLLRQTLLLKDFLASRHDRAGERTDGEFFGLDDARGFMGILAAEGTINKLWFMAEDLLSSAENEEGEAIPYFPYQTVVTPSSLLQEETEVEFVERDSRLFDQLSLLWALSEVMLLTDPVSTERVGEVFSQELLAPDIDFNSLQKPLGLEITEMSPEAVHELAKALAAIVFNTLTEFHWLKEEGTLLNRVLPGGRREEEQNTQKDSAEEEQKVRKVSATYLGLSLSALERYYEALGQEAETRETIETLMQDVANYLLDEMADAEKGGLFDEKQLRADEEQAESSTTHKSLQSQMAGIRGLLSAYTITQNESYRTMAFELYDYATREFWNEALGVFKDRERKGLYRYTPMDLAVVSGALRELIYQSNDSQQALDIMKQKKGFIRQLTKHAGLQLSEVLSGSEEDFLIPADGVGAIRTARALDSPFGLAPVLGSEIALNRDAITALNAERPTGFCEQGRNVFRSTYYLTDIGMYAASEFGLRTGAAVSTTASDDEAEVQERNRNPELLNLAAAERTAQKAKDFSDYNLVHIQTKSTLGVDLLYGPLLQKKAEALDIRAEEYLEEILARYAELAGLEEIPESLAPIFIEYEGGVPEIEYGGDSERWFDGNKDRSLLPSALGQSLRRQVLWLKDVLADRHDADNRLNGKGEFLGQNAEEGFLGLVTAQAVANKVLFLKETMLRPLESDSVSTPSGLYFPHRLEIDFNDNEPKAYELKDASSSLFDQLSLLWGLSELYGLLNADVDAPYRTIFDDDTLAGAQLSRITQELVGRLMENIEALHWDAEFKSLYEWNELDAEQDDEDEEESGETRNISTGQIAMAGIALESVVRNFAGEFALRNKAEMILSAQADFLSRHLYREEDGAVYNGASLEKKVEALKGVKTLLSHSAAVRVLLLAHQQTGDVEYLRKAGKTLEALDRSFWDPRLRVYKSAYGQYQYTPLNVAMTVGAFREFLALDRTVFLERFQQHFSEFFEQIVERTGLQLSEQQHFLEQLGEAKSLAPVFASDLTIQPVGSMVDMTIPQPGSLLTYIITVAEAELRCGIEDAYVEDGLPEGTSFVKSSPVPDSISGRVLRWRVADLNTNEDGLYEIRIVLRVNSQSELSLLGTDYRDIVEGRGSWNIKNCASLWCADPLQGEQELRSDCAEDELTVPQLGVEKSLRSVVAEPGREAEFEIVVTNFSDVTAYTLTIEDENPAGFIYLKDSARSRDVLNIELDDTQPLVWVLEDLEPDESLRLSYRVQIEPHLEEGVYRSVLKVHAMDRSGYQFDSNEFEFDVNVGRDMILKLDFFLPEELDPQQLQAGSLLPLKLSIENIGSETLLNSTVMLSLPEAFSYVSKSSRLNGVAFDEPELESRNLSWRLGEFAPGLSKTLGFFVKLPADGSGQHMLKAVLEGLSETGAEYRSPDQSLSLSLLPGK